MHSDAIRWTKGLRPTPGNTEADLGRLRAAIGARVRKDWQSLDPSDFADADPVLLSSLRESKEGQHRSAPREIIREFAHETPRRTAEQATLVHGPFLDEDGREVRFLEFREQAFFRVLQEDSMDSRLAFLVPIGVAAGSYYFGNGTVWVRSSALPLTGGSGFVGFRVSGGSLTVYDRGNPTLPPISGSELTIPSAAEFELVLDLEQPLVALTEPVNQADAIELSLPSRITFDSTGAVHWTGNVKLTGFGATQDFVPGPLWDADDATAFCRLTGTTASWLVEKNASRLMKFQGDVQIAGAALGLPFMPGEPSGEASAADLLAAAQGLIGEPRAFGSRRFHFEAALIRTSGLRFDVTDVEPATLPEFELRPWPTASATATLSKFAFTSLRGGNEIIGSTSGRFRASLDHPAPACGERLELEGGVLAFSAGLNVAGELSFWIDGVIEGSSKVAFLFENALVDARLSTFSILSHQAAQAFSQGEIQLGSDWGSRIIPTLPDPYAANFDLGANFGVEGGLAIGTHWKGDQIQTSASGLRTPGGSQQRFFLGGPRPARLLDISGAADQWGLQLWDEQMVIWLDGRLAAQTASTAIFAQPQVLWEPVIDTTVDDPAKQGHGPQDYAMTTGLVSIRSVQLVPLLPRPVFRAIAPSIDGGTFKLPNGMAVSGVRSVGDPRESEFKEHRSALQLRLPTLLGSIDSHVLEGPDGHNLLEGLYLIPPSLDRALVRLDLSGYGLSCVSHFNEDFRGISSVMQVLNGRTVEQTIRLEGKLWCAQARFSRIISIRRDKNGALTGRDSGWFAIDEGKFGSDIEFERGVIAKYSQIRGIRSLGEFTTSLSDRFRFERVEFDAHVELHDSQVIPVKGHRGVVQWWSGNGGRRTLTLTRNELQLVMRAAGIPFGGPIDGVTKVGSIPTKLQRFEAKRSKTASKTFCIETRGTPTLPRAGQWRFARLPREGSVEPVAARTGVPIVGDNERFRFREGEDYAGANVRYGLVVSTQGTRAVFEDPTIAKSGDKLECQDHPARLADPAALLGSTGLFPKNALETTVKPVLEVASSAWKVVPNTFEYTRMDPLLMQGAGWKLAHVEEVREFGWVIDPSSTTAWKTKVPMKWLLEVGTLKVMRIESEYSAASGGIPELAEPVCKFETALEKVKSIIEFLEKFEIKRLGDNKRSPFEVSVRAASSGSIELRLSMVLAVGRPDPIDIGMGKLSGEFRVSGLLEAGLGGPRGNLDVELSGDMQMGILPPLLYAGGFFRFAIRIRDDRSPSFELALAVVGSVGGDLIEGLIEAEITVRYGLIINAGDLTPAFLLGISARAKLLGGLVGFSFAAEVTARIDVVEGIKEMTIRARVRVTASIQIAILIDEDIDFETDFSQTIPLTIVKLATLGPAGTLL